MSYKDKAGNLHPAATDVATTEGAGHVMDCTLCRHQWPILAKYLDHRAAQTTA